MNLVAKAVPYGAAAIGLLAGRLAFQRVNPDAFLKKEGSPVTMEHLGQLVEMHGLTLSGRHPFPKGGYTT